MVSVKEKTVFVKHPLSALTEEEVNIAVQVVREQKQLSDQVMFASVALYEPLKEDVLNFVEGDDFTREVFIVLLDKEHGKTYEAIVSINDRTVVSYTYIENVQPGIILEEILGFDSLVKNDPQFVEALKKRGIEDVSLVNCDAWSAGNFGIAQDEGKRLVKGVCWQKKFPEDNAYAYPLTGLFIYFDLNKMAIDRIEDYGERPMPTLTGTYAPEHRDDITFREDIKPLQITQPEGASFIVEDNLIKWQKWSFRYGFTPREGLVLYTISYNDNGKERPIMYRASLSEMVVPYGDATYAHNAQNAFDAGEYGMGQLANSLQLGCDCLGHIQYFDAVMSDGLGNTRTIKNAICLHEEDFGVAWKHTDLRNNYMEVRRARKLVISFFCTVGNYDYGFYWSFFQDGVIDVEVKLTGSLNTGTLLEGPNKYGTEIAPGLNAVHHQHFFNFRLDMTLDGVKNSVVETETYAEELGPENPYSNGFYPVSKVFTTEKEAIRKLDFKTQRGWKIVNKNSKNMMGQPVGYKIMVGENCLPYAHEQSSVIKRAGFLQNHLYVTPFARNEMYASGNYPNQHAGGDGLSTYAQQDRPIDDEDIVVWYTMGHHHLTRLEDWPIMPTAHINFQLKPNGFFNYNPALDLPRPVKADSCSVEVGKEKPSCH